jgi:glycosyltransferase involved in cell wall biosynthesis
MHVVIVSRIFSPEPSAASFRLEAVAKAFRDDGHRVTVLTTRPPRGRVAQTIPGVSVRRARVLRDSSGYVRGYLPYLSFDLPLAFRLLFRRRADLYFVEPPPTTGAVVRVISRVLRRPYVYNAADIWSDAAKMATSSALVHSTLRRLEVFALRGASHVFAISSGVADRIRELEVATPTTVIGFGVDTEVFRYEPPAQATAAPYFVYAGTYSEWHGADIFVDAFARFSAEHPGYRLIFVGNGSDRDKLERKRTECGLTTVEFMAPIDGVALNTLLSAATASLASLKPGRGYDYAFTTKVYSSIAAGCPVLFTGVGPTADFITQTGESHKVGVVIPYDIGAVTVALARLADDPASASSRRRLSDWARNNFALASIATSVARTSNDVAGRA